MKFLKLLRDVLSPGSPEFRGYLSRADEDQARLLRCLHRLDQPVTREIRVSTDEAAEQLINGRDS